MKEENPPKIKDVNECSDLTETQKLGIFDKMDAIIKSYEGIMDKDLYDKKKALVINFAHVMEGEGLSINSYVLGRRLMSEANVKLEGPFDTEGHVIQEYIEEELPLKNIEK